MVRFWKGESPVLRFLLFIPLFTLAGIYRLCLSLREWLYRQGLLKTAGAQVPIISVGNLTLGGTGKTPVVEKLVTELKRRGFRPGIITRGYKRRRMGVFAVNPENDTAQDAGDEAAMLAKKTRLPVLVAKSRIDGISMGIARFDINVAVLDDGFQVRHVRKDVELLIMNGSERQTEQHLFPLGIYRDPLEAMNRADAILINKGHLNNRTENMAATKPRYKIQYEPVHLISVKDGGTIDYRVLRGKRVVAFSALGDNHSFFTLLKDLGTELMKTIEFPDHHIYQDGDLRMIASIKNADMIVTTEKDAVKIEHMISNRNFFYLVIKVRIEEEERLMDMIMDKLFTAQKSISDQRIKWSG